MKKFYSSLFIVLMYLLFFLISGNEDKTYTVLDVVEGDKIYVDINDDGKIDKNELFHIKNINTFPVKANKKSEYYAKKYKISVKDTVNLGYAAKKYTKRKLLHKRIEIIGTLDDVNENYKYRFIKIKFNGEDFAHNLLEEGLAIAYDKKGFNPYKSYESYRKIKENVRENSDLKLAALDNKYKIYHLVDCPNVRKIKEFDLVDFHNLEKGFKPCKYCYLKQNYESKVKSAISPYKTFNNVTFFFVHPLTFDEPSYFCKTKASKVIIENINNAKTSIDFALYGIDRQDEILSALIRAKNRGVCVRGVVDSKVDGSFVYSDTKKLVKNFPIANDNKSAFMHNKFFIFDKQKVFTGTMNMSSSGTGGYSANTGVLINSRAVAEIYTNEFNQMFEGKFQAAKNDKSVQNIQLNPDTVLSIFFSPKGKAYEKAVSDILKNAKKEIYVSAFYLTHGQIVEDLASACKRGVDVKIIYDAVGGTNMRKKVEYLRNSGAKLKVENWGGKNHEKNIEADGEYFITGSANLSFSGMNKNDENILVFKNKDIAGFYRAHFLNLYNSIDEKYLKIIPRAESFESGKSCFDGIDNNFDGKFDSEDKGCIKK